LYEIIRAVSVEPSVLEQIPLFAGLSQPDRDRIAAVTDDFRADAGATICRYGDFAYHFYALVDGSVDVMDGADTLAQLGPGDFFGEIGLLVTGRRTASVVAREPTRFVAMFDQPFRRLEAEIPEFSKRLRAAMGERDWTSGHDGG
jgi:CRP-like cAMP-binding protein